MKYIVRGKGSVTLSQENFIFQGGEGKVYGKGDTAYKIYHDPKKLIPEAKIRELQAIRHPGVIKPADAVLTGKGKYVGFTMPWVRDGVPLVKLFTNDFRNRSGVTDDMIVALAEAMKEAVAAVHQACCLMVDGNEFNYLADGKAYTTPYLIDVNAYQTPSFPASAIMPSIQDPHSATFSELTDWYGFAIVVCALFVGIHPFKGRHPDYTKKAMGGQVMLNRKKDNVSIFNPKVSMPPTTRDFGCIPKNYRDWFIDLFEKGKRLPPPAGAGATVTPATGTRIIQSTSNFEITHLEDFESDIVRHYTVFGVAVTKTAQKLHIGNTAFDAPCDADVLFTPQEAKPVMAYVENGTIQFSAPGRPSQKILAAPMACSEKMIIDNTLYVKNGGHLTEIALMDRENGDIVVAAKSTWQIMPHASAVFTGVIYQNVLGKPYLVIPMPENGGRSACAVVSVPELEGFRIVSAKHENHVCMMIVHRDDMYHRARIKFDNTFQKYDIRFEQDVEQPEVNFVVLDNGLAVAVTEDSRLEIFLNRFGNDRTDIIQDPDIRSDMTLCKDGVAMRFFRGRGLYGIRRSGK